MQAKKMLKKIKHYFLYSISEKTLKSDNIEVNKKEFHASKQPIDLNLVDKTVISNKFKHSDNGPKYFIGYKDDNIIRPLCIILPQMSGFIKYFDNGENTSLMSEDGSVFFFYIFMTYNLQRIIKFTIAKYLKNICTWKKIEK